MERVNQKHIKDKRALTTEFSQTEEMLKKQHEIHRKQSEVEIEEALKKNQILGFEIEKLNKEVQFLRLENTAEFNALQQKNKQMMQENDVLNEKVKRLMKELQDFKEDHATYQAKLYDFQELKKEADKLTGIISQRNAIITRLKEEIKKRDQELDEKDEENQLRVIND